MNRKKQAITGFVAVLSLLALPAADADHARVEGDVPDGEGGTIHVVAALHYEERSSGTWRAVGTHEADDVAYGELWRWLTEQEMVDPCTIPSTEGDLFSCNTYYSVYVCTLFKAKTGAVLGGSKETGWVPSPQCS